MPSNYANHVTTNLSPVLYCELGDASRDDTDPAVSLVGPGLTYSGDADSEDSVLLNGGTGALLGASDYVGRTDLGGLTIAPGRTMMGWARFGSLDSNSSLFGIANTGNDDFIEFLYITGSDIIRVRAETASGNTSFDSSSGPITAGEWNHWAVVLSAGNVLSVYRDGEAIAGSTGSLGRTSAGPLIHLGNGVSGVVNFLGAMQGWSYHNAALTADEVYGAYRAGAGLYELYRRDTPSGADTLVTTLPGYKLTHSLTDLLADSVGYYMVRAVSPCGVRDTDPVVNRFRRVAMDGSANLIDPAPNAPINLRLVQGPAGLVTARWAYRAINEEAAAAKFHVYVATGASAISYTTPDYTLTSVGLDNSQSLGTFANGTAVKCVVRAVTAGDVEETNTTEATGTADAAAPAVPSALTATVEAS